MHLTLPWHTHALFLVVLLLFFTHPKAEDRSFDCRADHEEHSVSRPHDQESWQVPECQCGYPCRCVQVMVLMDMCDYMGHLATDRYCHLRQPKMDIWGTIYCICKSKIELTVLVVANYVFFFAFLPHLPQQHSHL